MIEIRNVSKSYGNVKALDDVSVTINRGEIIGLFGENGAGKTTFIKSVFGFIPFKGEILLDGEKINRKNIGKLSFATSEHSFFPEINAAEHREFYKEHFDTFMDRRFDGLMEFFNLPMDKPIKKLSNGQQNQFEVILALSQGADYIFMDEPFSGSDMLNREDFYKVLMGIIGENETIFLSTHLIEEVAGFISRAILIREGRIIGDVHIEELEERGVSLTDYIKENYNYEEDRVSKALNRITGRNDADE
ncbi:MAG: ABC transporter ATP-binding protein [Erysipelotrichaceae bacterium]|nr:ABC transporter ATP-binding protein [Erysipelotrichaceae bacterium]